MKIKTYVEADWLVEQIIKDYPEAKDFDFFVKLIKSAPFIKVPAQTQGDYIRKSYNITELLD